MQSFTLSTEGCQWLAQVVVTEDGLVAGVTDWGNFALVWRTHGGSIYDFLLSIRPDYFANKLSQSAAFIHSTSKRADAAHMRLAKEILPALQNAIKRWQEKPKESGLLHRIGIEINHVDEIKALTENEMAVHHLTLASDHLKEAFQNIDQLNNTQE